MLPQDRDEIIEVFKDSMIEVKIRKHIITNKGWQQVFEVCNLILENEYYEEMDTYDLFVVMSLAVRLQDLRTVSDTHVLAANKLYTMITHNLN